MERLDQDPLRRFLLSSGERWGALMVFPDLRRSEVVAAWQRDPVFHEFRDVFRSEGLRTLDCGRVAGSGEILWRSDPGFPPRPDFEPQELRVALAIGNQVSVAVENWSLNRAAERRDEELRILHRVGEALRATFDMNAQIEILRRELTGIDGRNKLRFGFAGHRGRRRWKWWCLLRAPGRKAPCKAGQRVRWRNMCSGARQPLLGPQRCSRRAARRLAAP